MWKRLIHLLVMILLFDSCHDDPTEELLKKPIESSAGSASDSLKGSTPPAPLQTYFPPADNDSWESISPDSLQWNKAGLHQLLEFVASQNTFGFMILYKGRIVTENYWNGWNMDTPHPIASASKSITSLLTGIAQQEGLLKISDKTSQYLHEGWSSAPREKEDLITVAHHLSMTTGFDENENCISAECFEYVADAGKRWAYHNAAYNLIHKILESASGKPVDQFMKEKLADRIGMKNWTWQDYNLELNTRDMARFGLLIENKGKWKNEMILKDSAYYKAMISTSNPYNKSYGYLWWLNGKESYMIPMEPDVKEGPLVPSAPADMFAAMGKGDKKIYIIPSKNLVIVRHGEDTGQGTFGPSSFDTELWNRLAPVISNMSNK